MKIKCNTYHEAHKLAEQYEESHIEREGDCIYLVVDKPKKKEEPAYA